MRALGGKSRGFHVDVGANQPTLDSITCAFYERGWDGINIEPARAPFARLAAARARDVNLAVACSDVAGRRRFFETVEVTGRSTLDEGARALVEGDGLALEPLRGRDADARGDPGRARA